MRRWGIIYLGFIGVVIALSDMGSCGYLCAPAKAVAYGDKLGHFVLVGALAAAVYVAVTRRAVSRFGGEISIASLAVLVFISGEELSQIWIPSRSADWGDLVASYLGICGFELLRIVSNERELGDEAHR